MANVEVKVVFDDEGDICLKVLGRWYPFDDEMSETDMEDTAADILRRLQNPTLMQYAAYSDAAVQSLGLEDAEVIFKCSFEV